MQTSFQLKCFGVGDGWPCADRNHSAYLYQFGKTSFLIDCGEPVSSTYKRYKMDVEELSQIFISHLHFDHVGGLFMLLQGFWVEKRQRDLPIYLPHDGIEPIEKLLNAACLFEELLTYRPRLIPLEAQQVVMADKVKVTPFLNRHLESVKSAFGKKYSNRFESFSFLIEHENLRIGHSADIATPEDLAPLVENPLDLLVCELTHVKPDDLFRFLQDRPISRLLFVHVGRQYWENLENVRRLAEEMLPDVQFSFANDEDEIEL